MKNRIPIKFINFYQKKISPNTNPRCRFFPNCSEYCKECFLEYNFFYASFLSVKRILKCNPLSKGGYDPIPKIKKELKNKK